jgi:hypothetical protein
MTGAANRVWLYRLTERFEDGWPRGRERDRDAATSPGGRRRSVRAQMSVSKPVKT